VPTWVEHLEESLFVRSRDMAPPWGPLLRWLRYPAALIRDWLGGEINVRAMSLAYTTLLSIAPTIAFCFLMLKWLGARTNLEGIVHAFFQPVGAAAAQMTASLMQSVNNMRGGLLGSLGLVFLIYTVITTIQKVEASFQYIWRVENPRSLARRFGEYLAVMIVGPILIAAALGVLASAKNSPFAQWLGAIVPLGWTLSILGKLLPYTIVTIIFTVMYALIPNTRVQPRAALVGGVTAGLAWALVGKIFTAVILYSSQMMVIYAGFAMVLTTLIWLYLSWLILLIGAQLSFYIQLPEYLPIGQAAIALHGSARERAALSVMYLIGRDAAAGGAGWTGERLAAELQIPGAALAPLLASLVGSGLLVTNKASLAPGRDMREIALADILDAVRAQSGRSSVAARPVAPAALVVAQIEAATRGRLAGRTLKDLIAAV
jgi:membrane protein